MKLLHAISIFVTVVLWTGCCCDAPQKAPKAPSPKKHAQRVSPTVPTPVSTESATSALNPLPVQAFEREGYLSCWSTSAEIIMDYVGHVRNRQCKQANLKWPANPDCCDSTDTLKPGSKSDLGAYPDFQAWKFNCDIPPKPLSWEDIKKEIDAGRPFAFSRLEKGNGVEHMMVVCGYSTGAGNKRWLLVTDPSGFQTPALKYAILYAEYAGNSAYENKSTFYNIKPAP